MMVRPTNDANQRPILCPKGPNMFVPIKYEMDAGKKAAPNCHFSAFILSIMKIGKDGSSMAIPILANVMAPFFYKIIYYVQLEYIQFRLTHNT